jgi:hypothetical protein
MRLAHFIFPLALLLLPACDTVGPVDGGVDGGQRDGGDGGLPDGMIVDAGDGGSIEDGSIEDGSIDGSIEDGGPLLDTGAEPATDAGADAGVDAGSDAGSDAGTDAGSDAGTDAGSDAGSDAGTDAGRDAGVDAGSDAGPADPCLPLPSGLTTSTHTDSASVGTPDTYSYAVNPGDPFCVSITGGGSGSWSVTVSNGTSLGVYCSDEPTCSIFVPPGQTTLLVTAVTTDIGGYVLTVRYRPR